MDRSAASERSDQDMASPTLAPSFLTPPFLQRLASPTVRKVVIVGCGGGFDFVHSMLLYPELRRMGKEVVIVSNSFGNVEHFEAEPISSEYRARPPMDVRLVTAKTRHLQRSIYAPELHVLSFLDKQFPDESPHSMYACYARDMVVPSFSRFLEGLGADALVAVDGGSDSLMVGDEEDLGDPIEDAVTVSSIHECSAPVKILFSVGLGCDRFNGVSDASSLRAIAELTRDGGFLGCQSVCGLPLSFYQSCLNHIKSQQSFRSVLAGCISAAGDGFFGCDKESAEAVGPRVRPGSCFLWPLMPMLWAFDINTVSKRSKLVSWVRCATTTQELQQMLRYKRQVTDLRGVEELPRHVDFRC